MEEKTGGGGGSSSRTAARRGFLFVGLFASMTLLWIAVALNGRVRLAMPLALSALSVTMLAWVLVGNTRVAKRVGPWRAPFAAAVVVLLFLGTGGLAYTYGSAGSLELRAIPDSAPLDLRDGANHTVTFELRNTGHSAVRFVNWGLSLVLVDANGSWVGGNFTCPVLVRAPATDADTEELAAGQAFRFERRFWAEGAQLHEYCHDWNTVSGGDYQLFAALSLVPGAVTLPHWSGTLESNRVPAVV